MPGRVVLRAPGGPACEPKSWAQARAAGLPAGEQHPTTRPLDQWRRQCAGRHRLAGLPAMRRMPRKSWPGPCYPRAPRQALSGPCADLTLRTMPLHSEMSRPGSEQMTHSVQDSPGSERQTRLLKLFGYRCGPVLAPWRAEYPNSHDRQTAPTQKRKRKS